MDIVLGSVVAFGKFEGVVSDIDSGFGEALVRYTANPYGAPMEPLDATHGRWMPLSELELIGHDVNAMVWRGQKMSPAGPRRDGK